MRPNGAGCFRGEGVGDSSEMVIQPRSRYLAERVNRGRPRFDVVDGVIAAARRCR